jgi:hypothetical protein
MSDQTAAAFDTPPTPRRHLIDGQNLVGRRRLGLDIILLRRPEPMPGAGNDNDRLGGEPDFTEYEEIKGPYKRRPDILDELGEWDAGEDSDPIPPRNGCWASSSASASCRRWSAKAASARRP